MKYLILPVFLFAMLFSTAQEHPNWVNYTSTQSVKKVVQNKNILWIGTTGGLIKHDLSTKTNQYFNRGNSSIPGNDVNDLLLDRNYDLWVATGNGIARFDGEVWTDYLDKIEGFQAYVLSLNMLGQVMVAGNYNFYTLIDGAFVLTPDESLLYLHPTDMVTNPVDSSIWVTAFTFGQFQICSYKDTIVDCFDQNNSILPMESPRINSLAVDQHGTIWADGGYYKPLNEDWQRYESTDGMNIENIYALAIGTNHHLWLLSYQEENQRQLIELDEHYQVVRRINLPEELNYNYYYQQLLYLTDDIDYDIYVGSAFNGLWRFKNDTWERIDIHADFEIGNNTEQIFLAKEAAWIKSNHQNYQDSEFRTRNTTNNEWSLFSNTSLPDSLQSISRSGIVNQLDNGHLQFFVNNHAWFYDEGNWIDADLPDVSNLLDENRSLIYFDPDGRRWLLDKWTAFVLYESPSGWQVFAPSEHGNSSGNSTGYFNHPVTGEFWMAGYSGLSVYDGQTWRQIKPAEQTEQLNNNRIIDIVVTKEGVVWAIQLSHLLRFEGEEMQVFSEINGNSLRNSLASIELDAAGNIWLGMNSALGFFDQETWTIYDTKNSGVITDRIHQLAIDEDENVWMGGHNSGLSIFNPNGLSTSFFINQPNTIDPEDETTSFNIFPNPHTKGGRLCINLPTSFSTDETTRGSWYNSLGQKLGVFTTTESLTVLPGSYFSGWSPGVYYLQLENKVANSSQSVLLNQ